ncbi:MAG: protein kinase [Candidatus Obscuribacterales bacterium]
MPDTEICSRCLKAKTVSPGSIGGLYEVCNCSTASGVEQQAITVLICNICKKHIDKGRQGSFTQWVFRPVLCQCENPEVIQTVELIDRDKLIAESSEIDDYPELDVDGFPSDRFSPRRKLGSGATSEVFLSRDRFLRKDVSVKLLRWLNDETVVSFQNEARVNASLKHENIVEVLDFGTSTDGVPFLVQEYIEGITLEDYLSEHGPLEAGEAVSFFAEIADALTYAHGKGILHRDLKPSNILIIDSEDRLSSRLIDFGIAHMREGTSTREGIEVAGTPRYMSPDAASGRAYDARSEIYSLGCVMYAALTGYPPFDGETSLEIISMHSSHQPEPIDIDTPAGESLERIIFRCLEKEPENRYQSAQELKEALLGGSDLPAAAEPERMEASAGATKKIIFALIAITAISVTATGALLASRTIVKKEPSKSSRMKDQDETWQTESLSKALIESAVTPHANSPREYLESVKSDPQVKEANFFMCDLTDRDLEFIGEKKLEILNLSYNPVTDITMKRLEKMDTLETLILRAVNITDGGIESIAKLPRLSKLTISAIPLTTRSFDAISKIRSLESFYMEAFNNLTPEDLKKLRALPKLDTIYLARCNISAPIAREIAELPHLTNAYLPNCIVAAGSLANLARSTSLSELDLTGCDFPPEELMTLSRLKGLKRLSVMNCPKADRKVIKQLKAARPDLGIYFSDKNTEALP